MKQLLYDHFREILLCVMSLIFAGVAMWATKHDAQEFFKWASASAGTLLGALLMLMRGDATPRPPVAPPPPAP